MDIWDGDQWYTRIGDTFDDTENADGEDSAVESFPRPIFKIFTHLPILFLSGLPTSHKHHAHFAIRPTSWKTTNSSTMKFFTIFLFALTAAPAVANRTVRRRNVEDNSHPFYTCIALAGSEQELPEPDKGGTTAAISLNFKLDLSEVLFDLEINKGEKITQAHLHCASAGSNGPVVVTLFDKAPLEGPGGVDIDGPASYGSISNKEIFPTACGDLSLNNVASLFAAALAGDIYLNVHSEEYPDGVARGQFFECF
jgi:hypothetical protein